MLPREDFKFVIFIAPTWLERRGSVMVSRHKNLALNIRDCESLPAMGNWAHSSGNFCLAKCAEDSKFLLAFSDFS